MLDDREKKYKRLVLIGMPCAGKSSIGRVISQHYRMAFYDLDEEIEKYAGMTIEEIFRTSGEAEFRKIETHVTEMMANTEDAVIVFRDDKGRRYLSGIQYAVTRLIDYNTYIPIARRFQVRDKGFLLHLVFHEVSDALA